MILFVGGVLAPRVRMTLFLLPPLVENRHKNIVACDDVSILPGNPFESVVYVPPHLLERVCGERHIRHARAFRFEAARRSSAARCRESRALPPFPKKTSLPAARRAAADFSANSRSGRSIRWKNDVLTRRFPRSWRRNLIGRQSFSLQSTIFRGGAPRGAWRWGGRVSMKPAWAHRRWRQVVARMIGGDYLRLP